MKDLVFASMAIDAESHRQVLTLLASLRTFGGKMAQAPFWIMVPKRDPVLGTLVIDDPHVRVLPFDWAPGDATFPFARKLAAGAAAESYAEGAYRLIAWMAPETLIVQEPRPFLLADGKAMGGRPVDELLIGPEWGAPLDPFWAGVFGASEVPDDRFFRVETSIGRIPLRNHMNSGLLVVRPERGILRAWWEDFLRLYREPVFDEFYRRNDFYRLLMHQVALARTALRMTRPEEVEIFPELVSYPLHLHDRYPADLRPRWMEEVVTARYYLDYDAQCVWGLPASEPLHSWLKAHVG